MKLKQLSATTLGAIQQGTVAIMVDTHLRRIGADCYDRPGDPKARVVTIQIEMIPVLDTRGNCDKVATQIQVASKVPTHRTAPMSMRLGENGQVAYNPENLDDVDQGTLFEEEEEEAE